MGSVAFVGDDESQPSTRNDGKSCKLSTTLLDGCDAVNRASIPKKLRSAVKKRGRESIMSPLLISRKQNHVSTTVDTLKKDGSKKSKLNMKQGHITKDEKEVAETLYALAAMFSDANKSDQQGMDDEKPEIKSSATLEEGSLINAAQDTCPILQEETRKMSSKVTHKSLFPSSNLVNSTAEEVKSQTIEAPQPEFFSSKKAVAPNASGDQSNLSPGSTSRPLVSILGSNQRGEQEIHLDQVTASVVQYDNNYSSIDLSATGATSSEKHRSCQRSSSARIPSLFESTIFSSQPHFIEKNIAIEKLTGVANKTNKSWKRCSAHVYISRLINVLQISDRKEGIPVQHTTQSTTCGGAELQPPVSNHNQMPRINGRNGDAYFSAIDHFAAKKDSSETQTAILLHKRPIEDHQMASETSSLCSAKQGYDFLSLGTGIFCGSETSNSANRAGCFREPPKQFHMPYMQSQNHSSLFCSLPQNGYSSSFHVHNSALATQQVQLAQYNSSTVNSNFTARTGQQTEIEMQQQKWAAQLQTHYNTGGGGVPHFPDWKNGGIDSASVLNYAHSLFPHLHAALGSKYQQLSPSQQQVMAINSSLPLSNMKRHHHNLHLGLERNGGVYHPENMAQLQLQLPCNQKL